MTGASRIRDLPPEQFCCHGFVLGKTAEAGFGNEMYKMRIAAFDLFGDPQVLGSQPNVFGELLRVLISPSKEVEAAVNWVIGDEENPDISLHMQILMNRYAGPLSCHNQTNQCAFTPLLPPGWWDGLWQSPIQKDINRLAAYGIKLSGLGTVDYDSLQNYCSTRKNVERTVTFSL
ncbi:hypothetical protein JHK85_053853 [Glycine max]|nr:hypothetical protein JHK85_053853 [Glycine max]